MSDHLHRKLNDETLAELVLTLGHGVLVTKDRMTRERVIKSLLEAALTFSLETHGPGNERKAIKKVDKIFKELFAVADVGIKNGRFQGSSPGGYYRPRTDNSFSLRNKVNE